MLAVWPAGNEAVGVDDGVLEVEVGGVELGGVDDGGVLVGGVLLGGVVVVPSPPPQVPNPAWHPVPQYSGPSPHQKNSEQHPPILDPAQVVEFPHMPLVLGVREPAGGVAEPEGDDDVGEPDGDVLVGGVEDSPPVGSTRGSPSHQPKSGWHPTSARQNWSPSPQKPNWEQHVLPGQIELPGGPQVPPPCRRPSWLKVSRTLERRPPAPLNRLGTPPLCPPRVAPFAAPVRPRVAATPMLVHRMVGAAFNWCCRMRRGGDREGD